MWQIGLLILTFVLSLGATFLVKKIATYFKILDYPTGLTSRKIHNHPIPLMGGAAIAASFFIGLGFLIWQKPNFITHISSGQLLAIFVASLFLMIGGWLDDKFNLPPIKQIVFPLMSVLIVVVVGVNLKEITNPLGGKINLLAVSWLGRFIFVDLIALAWLSGMMYTTKLLDGLDGLVAGLTIIGSAVMGFLSLTDKFYQPDIALICFVFAVANLGFLFFNFYPAKIFLGEGGSLFTGFILGVLAIVAGGKIATALLVMGVAIVDLAAVIVRRLRHKTSPFKGDSGHLHQRLLKIGFSQRQVVLLFYCLAIIFGVLTLFLQSRQKLLALSILFILVVILIILVDLKNKTYAAK